jgi:hypothetical protein
MPNEYHLTLNVAINQSRGRIGASHFDHEPDKSRNGQNLPNEQHIMSSMQHLPAMGFDNREAAAAAPLLYKSYLDHLCLTPSQKAPQFQKLGFGT